MDHVGQINIYVLDSLHLFCGHVPRGERRKYVCLCCFSHLSTLTVGRKIRGELETLDSIPFIIHRVGQIESLPLWMRESGVGFFFSFWLGKIPCWIGASRRVFPPSGRLQLQGGYHVQQRIRLVSLQVLCKNLSRRECNPNMEKKWELGSVF